MLSKSLRGAIALGVVSGLSAGAAYAIHFISAAHGHGLASSDRLAIWLLSLLAVGGAVGSLWLVIRRA